MPLILNTILQFVYFIFINLLYLVLSNMHAATFAECDYDLCRFSFEIVFPISLQ